MCYTIWLVICFLATRGVITAAEVGSFDAQSKESVEFQAVNSYLTDWKPLTGEPAQVAAHLREAVDAIESLGVEVFGQLQPDGDLHGDKFKSLMSTDAQVTLTVLRKLLAASTNCDQESLDFLVLVVEHETFQGQFLNQYARNLLAKCWQQNLNALTDRLERMVGKMSVSLFELLEEVARRLQSDLDRARRAKGSLVIGERKSSLKQVALDTSDQQRDFARAVKGALSSSDGMPDGGRAPRDQLDRLRTRYLERLVEPCEELSRRAQTALTGLLPYERYAGKASESLDARRALEPALDLQLEAHRICRELEAKREAIWEALAH